MQQFGFPGNFAKLFCGNLYGYVGVFNETKKNLYIVPSAS